MDMRRVRRDGAILGGCADSRNGEQGEPGDEGRQQANGGTRHPTLLPKRAL